MPAYEIFDDLPRLTGAERDVPRLVFAPASSNSVGWDYSASYSGFEDYAILNDTFGFYALKGSTITIASISFFDPFLLRVFDQYGNVVVYNDEADDIVFELSDGDYLSDVIFDWEAPYTGLYYVRASWNQGSFYTYHSLLLNADVDTAIDEPEFRTIMAPNSLLSIGGAGDVFGTMGNERIAIAELPSFVRLDPSFNRGGDLISLGGLASEHEIAIVSGQVEIWNEFRGISIPVGPNGITIRFEDGDYNLRFDVMTQKVYISDQLVTASFQWLESEPDVFDTPVYSDVPQASVVLLDPGATFGIAGNANIFGSASGETFYYAGGDVTLDPSFNRGGDVFHFGITEDYEIRLNGSSAQLRSELGIVDIPLGPNGLIMNFDGTEETLAIVSGKAMIGDQMITSDWASLQMAAFG
jgi:hypothetical protein